MVAPEERTVHDDACLRGHRTGDGTAANQVLATVIIFSLFVPACRHYGLTAQQADTLNVEYAATADPVQDSTRAIKRGDHRLIIVQGLGIAAPGAETRLDLFETLGTKLLKDWTDGPTDDDMRQRAAYNYALIHNLLILRSVEGAAATTRAQLDVETRDPVKDLRAALRRHDARLLGLGENAESAMIPYVREMSVLADKLGVRLIPSTSAQIDRTGYRNAFHYAAAYNMLLLRHLRIFE